MADGRFGLGVDSSTVSTDCNRLRSGWHGCVRTTRLAALFGAGVRYISLTSLTGHHRDWVSASRLSSRMGARSPICVHGVRDETGRLYFVAHVNNCAGWRRRRRPKRSNIGSLSAAAIRRRGYRYHGGATEYGIISSSDMSMAAAAQQKTVFSMVALVTMRMHGASRVRGSPPVTLRARGPPGPSR